MTHFDHLSRAVPNLIARRILDVGSGRGKFIVDFMKRGGDVSGIEINPAYIAIARERARAAGIDVKDVKIIEGVAENLPFPDRSFGFVNLSEVVEHVRDPNIVMREVSRVLAPGGMAYVSAPARYSVCDPHFHILFVNWIPRAWCNRFVSLFGSHKDYSGPAGIQNLVEMHYYTYGGFRRLLENAGFEVADIRELEIKKRYPAVLCPFAFAVYRLIARPFAYGSMHVLAKKL